MEYIKDRIDLIAHAMAFSPDDRRRFKLIAVLEVTLGIFLFTFPYLEIISVLLFLDVILFALGYKKYKKIVNNVW
jgi:hypothetical protein